MSIDDPTFAVVVPVHNGERWVIRALDSVLCQTVQANEVLVGDDGSSDGTLDLLKQHDLAHEVCRYVVDPHERLGVATTRNRLVERSKADWVVLLDADDVMCSTRLERIAGAIRSAPSVDVVTTDAVLVDADGASMGFRWYRECVGPPPEEISFESLVGTNWIFGAAAVRRDLWLAVGGMEPLTHAEDYLLWLKLAARDAKFEIIPEPLYRYTQHNRQASANAIAGARGVVEALQWVRSNRLVTGPRGATLEQAIKAAQAQVRWISLQASAAAGQPPSRADLLWMGLHGSTLRLRSKAVYALARPTAWKSGIPMRDISS